MALRYPGLKFKSSKKILYSKIQEGDSLITRKLYFSVIWKPIWNNRAAMMSRGSSSSWSRFCCKGEGFCSPKGESRCSLHFFVSVLIARKFHVLTGWTPKWRRLSFFPWAFLTKNVRFYDVAMFAVLLVHYIVVVFNKWHPFSKFCEARLLFHVFYQ